MQDLLVPLYHLPPRSEGEGPIGNTGVNIRRANTFELSLVRDFITCEFSQSWADESAAVFARQPIPCFIATLDRRIVGFATVDSTRRGFFGPTGVAKDARGRGIGKALLIAALWSLWDLGYAYAVIGAAGPVDFYAKAVHAIPIPNSWPGIYTDLLERK
ncbi:MAG: GNAT family N-acetyltransferase [Capsulimonadaceae bacterium]